MKFKKFLYESPVLSPEHQAEFKKLGETIKYKDRYKNLFGTSDRVYLKVPGSINIDDFEYDIYFDMSIVINRKIKELEFKYSSDFEYEEIFGETPYVKFSPTGSTSKRVDDKLEYTNSELIAEYGTDEEKKQLKSRPKIGKHDNLEVMISRNPCDIGAMSTRTPWTSCMNLYDGMYNKYTRNDVRFGTLIAYLIDSNDKSAKTPLGRKLIKPYVNKDKTYLVLTKPVYGTFTDEAESVIQKWLDSHQKDIEGYFELHKNMYKDDDVKNITVKKDKE